MFEYTYYSKTKFLLSFKSLPGQVQVPHMFTHMPDNVQVVSLPVTLTGDKNVLNVQPGLYDTKVKSICVGDPNWPLL